MCIRDRLKSATTAPVSTRARSTERLARERSYVVRPYFPDARRRNEIGGERVRIRSAAFVVEILIQRAQHGFRAFDPALRTIFRQFLFDAKRQARVDMSSHGMY